MDASANKYNKLFLIAAEKGHFAAVKNFLENKQQDFKIQIESRNENRVTALFLAAQNGHTQIVEYLISKGANVNDAKNIYDKAPLMIAALNGHLDVVNVLIEAKADVNEMGKGAHSSALIQAASNAHLPVIEALIKAGANVNAATQNGHTALMTAVFSDNTTVVSRLLEAGADPYMENWEGQTAYDIAVDNNFLVSAKILEETMLRDENPYQLLREAIKYKDLQVVRWVITEAFKKLYTEFKKHPTYYLFSATTRLAIGMIAAYALSYGLTTLVAGTIFMLPKYITAISLLGGIAASTKLCNTLLSRIFGEIKIRATYAPPQENDTKKEKVDITISKARGILEIFGQSKPYVTPINDIVAQLEKQHHQKNNSTPAQLEKSKSFALFYAKKIVEAPKNEKFFDLNDKIEVKSGAYLLATSKFKTN